jgi:hypothetical protein
MTTAVSNPAAQIDFTNDPFPSRIPSLGTARVGGPVGC